MLLKDYIDKINEILEGYYNRPVINQGYNRYDEKNGRKIIKEYVVNNIVGEVFKDPDIRVYMDKGKFNILGIEFKVRKKKSDMKSFTYYTNMMTIVKIELDDSYKNQDKYLDMDLKQIKQEYEETQRKAKESKENYKQAKVDEFITMLKEKNLSLKDFKELYNKYYYSDYGVQHLINSQCNDI